MDAKPNGESTQALTLSAIQEETVPTVWGKNPTTSTQAHTRSRSAVAIHERTTPSNIQKWGQTSTRSVICQSKFEDTTTGNHCNRGSGACCMSEVSIGSIRQSSSRIPLALQRTRKNLNQVLHFISWRSRALCYQCTPESSNSTSTDAKSEDQPWTNGKTRWFPWRINLVCGMVVVPKVGGKVWICVD